MGGRKWTKVTIKRETLTLLADLARHDCRSIPMELEYLVISEWSKREVKWVVGGVDQNQISRAVGEEPVDE